MIVNFVSLITLFLFLDEEPPLGFESINCKENSIAGCLNQPVVSQGAAKQCITEVAIWRPRKLRSWTSALHIFLKTKNNNNK